MRNYLKSEQLLSIVDCRINNSETVTLVSRPRPSVTCQDVRRSANAGGSGGSEGQTNAKKMALNRSRAIKASQ